MYLLQTVFHYKSHRSLLFIYTDLYLLVPISFSSVAKSCPTLCDPMDHTTPRFPVHHQLPELARTHVHWVGDPIQPSHSLSSPSPPALLICLTYPSSLSLSFLVIFSLSLFSMSVTDTYTYKWNLWFDEYAANHFPWEHISSSRWRGESRREKVNSQRDDADMSDDPNNQLFKKSKNLGNKENEKCN